jgi:hypothetical protein
MLRCQDNSWFHLALGIPGMILTKSRTNSDEEWLIIAVRINSSAVFSSNSILIPSAVD